MDFSNQSFVYNAAAYFAAQEKYPDGLGTAILQNGMEGLDALCWALEELSTQGELIRRSMGYDKREPIKAKEAALVLSAYQATEARRIILGAISKGLTAPEDEGEEVDEVLAELQKKTGNQ